METKKVLTIVFSLLAIFILGFAISWSVINFNKVKDSMSGTELYTNEDLKNSYQDGYDTALKDKDEYDELINGYRDTITTLTDNVSSLNSQITTLTNTNKEHQNQISQLIQIKELNEETIVELNKTIDLNTTTIDGLNKEISNLNAEITSLDNIVSNKELTINELNNQIVDLNNQISGLNQTVSTNEQTIADLRITINTLNAEIEELSSNKVENENTISSLNNQIIELNSQINDLTSENSQHEQTITELNNEITLLNTDIDNKEIEIATLTATNQSLNNQITNLNALIDDLEKVNESNLSTIGGLNNQIALQKSQIADLQNQVLNNDASIYELNTTISNLEKSIAYYENYIFELENQNHLVSIFEFDGTVYAICDADDNGKVTVANPISTEYVIFNYWTVDGVRIELSNYVLEENTKFVANVTYKYNVKFLVDEEVYDSQIVEEGNSITIPTTPTKEKHDFLGWSIDGTNIIELEDYTVVSNITFVAIFQSTYGLFNPDTGAMVYSWQELQDYDYISVEDNELKAGVNVKRISGDLYVDSDVKSIADSTFNNCSALANVYLTDNVESIGNQAFYECLSLKNIEFSNNLKDIGDSAFNGCTSLTRITMPDSVVYTGASIFRNCTNLVNVKLSESLQELKEYSFHKCTSLSNIIIPDAMRVLGLYCFGYDNLTSVNLNNVEKSYDAFYDNVNIEEIIMSSNILEYQEYVTRLPKLKFNEYAGVKYLGNSVYPYLVMLEIEDKTVTSVDFALNVRVLLKTFSQVTGITEITLPNTIVNIGRESFYKAKITSLVFPESVKILSDEATHWGSLKSVVLNEGLEYIGDGAFERNNITGALSIPSTVKYIGDDAFNCNCYISSIEFGENPQLEYIGYWAFASVTSLRSIFIPKSVEVINSLFVYGTNYSVRPTFNSCHTDLVIYIESDKVPSGWTENWNYRSTTEALEYKLGYTYEQYLAEINSVSE